MLAEVIISFDLLEVSRTNRSVPNVTVVDATGSGADRCREVLFARNIKGAHFAVGFDLSHQHLPKGAPL